VPDSLTRPISARRCDYCDGPLDSRFYFCPRCSKPHRPVEELLPASLPAYEDNETKLRTQAGPAWTVFFSYLVVIGAGSMLALAFWGFDNETAAVLFMGFLLTATTVVFLIRSWSSVRPQLVRVGFSHSAAWIGMALLLPVLLLNFGYHHLLIDLFDLERIKHTDYFSNQWGAVLFICVLPGIIEEIGFRGIIQDQFERVVSPGVAIGVASLAFSAAHFSILSAPYLALVGALLGWMKWKSGSLYPSMVAHFLHNFIVVSSF
jgi:membrane protease YdiL (CAAX protease family)